MALGWRCWGRRGRWFRGNQHGTGWSQGTCDTRKQSCMCRGKIQNCWVGAARSRDPCSTAQAWCTGGGNKCLLRDGRDLRAIAEPGDRPSWASGLALLRWVGRQVSLGLWVPSWPCAPRLPTFHVYSLSLGPDGAPTVCLELPHDAGSSPPAPMALPQSPAPYTPQT